MTHNNDEDRALDELYDELDVGLIPGQGEVYDIDAAEDMPEAQGALPPIEQEESPIRRRQDRSLTPEELLAKYWGYDSFRPLQREIIDAVLDGRDVLGLMPTGGGKSMTFQISGLKLPGITLVITPLISLMKDQVDGLARRKIRVAAINSSMTNEKIIRTLDNCIWGKYKFLYISPERIASPLFRSRLEALNVSLIVVDECHCISQWGYDFRPAYLNIIELRSLLADVPVLALTATATPAVADDVSLQLGFKDNSVRLQQSFARPNISYAVRQTTDKASHILHILRSVAGSAIVYCRSRKTTRDIAKLLNAEGISADFFHAGLNHTERALRQNRWMEGDLRVIVATNAFGMGIDKPDVRLVIHHMMPNSLEEFFQEAGRAGRDNKLSYTVAVIAKEDYSTLKRRISDEFPPRSFIYQVYDSVCNHFQIGIGEGLQRSFDFDPDLFIRRFHLQPIHTMAAIRILTMAGIWEYHEEESRSRLMFLVSRQELYHYKNQTAIDEELIVAILRSYPGVFTDYIFIDELLLASKTGFTANEVYMLLIALDKNGVLHYIPRKRTPRILMLTRREEPRHLNIPKSIYEDRRKRFAERIAATLNYVQRTGVCRQRLLLDYFGEKAKHNCGLCDICLQRLPNKVYYHQTDAIRRLIAEARDIGERQMRIAEMARALELDRESFSRALSQVFEQDEQLRLDGDLLYL